MSDIVDRLHAALQVNPTHLLRNADIAEAGSCIKHLRVEVEELRRDIGLLLGQIDYIVDATGEDLDQEDVALREQIRAERVDGQSTSGSEK